MGQKQKIEKRLPFQQMLLEKLDICLQKTETRSMPVTFYKYQLKTWNLEDGTGKRREYTGGNRHRKGLLQ
jgi:hypothetical protein